MELNLILFCESFNGNWKRSLFFGLDNWLELD